MSRLRAGASFRVVGGELDVHVVGRGYSANMAPLHPYWDHVRLNRREAGGVITLAR
jgi:hypothetical protein